MSAKGRRSVVDKPLEQFDGRREILLLLQRKPGLDGTRQPILSRRTPVTSKPAKAGGAPIRSVAKSTTSENFLDSSTTASSETSSSRVLSASIRFEMWAASVALPVAALTK